jgi:hypothetical protein
MKLDDSWSLAKYRVLILIPPGGQTLLDMDSPRCASARLVEIADLSR